MRALFDSIPGEAEKGKELFFASETDEIHIG